MLTSHFTQGETPTDIARGLRDVFGVTTVRAQAIARTETMRAYRTATQETFKENDDIIKGWRWLAMLTYSTCIACVMQHGKEFPLDTPMDSHINCRCVQVPVTKTFAELGATGAKENDTSMESGKDWLERQPEETQRKVLGASKYDAWRQGKVSLDDLVAHSHNEKWGGSYHEATLSQALKSAEAQRDNNKSIIAHEITSFHHNSTRDVLHNEVSGELGKKIDHGLDQVDKVLLLPNASKMPIIEVDTRSYGSTVPANTEGAPLKEAHIQISRNSPHPELTTVHEIGHNFHLNFIGERGIYDRLSGREFAALKEAIEESNAFGQIKAVLLNDEYESGHMRIKLTEYTRSYFRDYLLSEKELFARSFTQYISQKSNDPILLQQVEGIQMGKTSDRWRHWSRDDFSAIEKAIDDIMKHGGFLK